MASSYGVTSQVEMYTTQEPVGGLVKEYKGMLVVRRVKELDVPKQGGYVDININMTLWNGATY